MKFGFVNIAGLISGIGLLIYGIKILGEGLELAAGAKLKTLLERMTKNRFFAVLVGFVITTLMQSSTATTLMVVGFVNTGIMNLTQAIGVIMGANIGTTTTSVLVSLSIGDYAPIAIGIGAFWSKLAKKNTHKHLGLALTGFGMLFLGMNVMKSSMAPLAEWEVFNNWIIGAQEHYLLAIVIGAVTAAVLHSSAASIGILQALFLQGVIPFNFAVYVIYGQNIGTCVTAFYSSLGAKKNSKRTAVMHILFNVFGTIFFIIGSQFIPYTSWIESICHGNRMMQLSIVHILFNVVSTIIMFPFANILVKLSCLIIPDKDEEGENDFRMQYVDNLMLNTPPFAVAQVSKEVHRMALLARNNFNLAASDLLNNSVEHFEEIQHTEDVINYLNHNITPILVKINALDLSYHDAKYIGRVFHVINDIERIGDHAQNLSEAAQSRVNENLQFSEAGDGELKKMLDTTLELIDCAVDSFLNQELTYENATKINALEASVDKMQEEFEQSHIDRLNDNICDTKSGMLFINTITDFERVADHATNIAWKVSNKPKINK